MMKLLKFEKMLTVEIFNIPTEIGNIKNIATGIIRDDDIVGISIHDTEQFEGDSGTSEMNFRVTLDVESEIPIYCRLGNSP